MIERGRYGWREREGQMVIERGKVGWIVIERGKYGWREGGTDGD